MRLAPNTENESSLTHPGPHTLPPILTFLTTSHTLMTPKTTFRPASLFAIILSLSQVLPASASAEKPGYEKTSLSSISEVLKVAKIMQLAGTDDSSSHLPDESSHTTVYKGPAGPFKNAYTLISRHQQDTNLWVISNVEGEWHAWGVLHMEGEKEEAIFFDDVQDDGFVEIFFLSSHVRGNIHGAWTIYTTAALEWQQKTNTFISRPEWLATQEEIDEDSHTVGLTSAAKVRAYLTKHKPWDSNEKKAVKESPPGFALPTKKEEAALRKTIRIHRNEMVFCYEKALEQTPGLHGEVRVTINIKSNGQTSSLSISPADTARSESLEACMKSKIEKWIFSESQNGLTITYPFMFSPSANQPKTSSKKKSETR